AQVATFYRARGKGERKMDCPPPLDAVRALLAREVWPREIVPIVGITETPVMRPDGSILDTPGYDAATRLVYVLSPPCLVPPIPLAPSAAERAECPALTHAIRPDSP